MDLQELQKIIDRQQVELGIALEHRRCLDDLLAEKVKEQIDKKARLEACKREILEAVLAFALGEVTADELATVKTERRRLEEDLSDLEIVIPGLRQKIEVVKPVARELAHSLMGSRAAFNFQTQKRIFAEAVANNCLTLSITNDFKLAAQGSGKMREFERIVSDVYSKN